MFIKDKYYYFRYDWMIPAIDGWTILKQLQTGGRLGITYLYGKLYQDDDGYWVSPIFVRVRSEDFLRSFVEFIGIQIGIAEWQPVTEQEFLHESYSLMDSAVPDVVKTLDQLDKLNQKRRLQN